MHGLSPSWFSPGSNKMADKHVIVRSEETNAVRNYKGISSIKGVFEDFNVKRDFVGLCVSKDGSLLAADVKNNEVCIFDVNGSLMSTFKATANKKMTDVVILIDGNIAICDSSTDDVYVYTIKGMFVHEFGCSDELKGTCGLAVDKNGLVFVVCPNNEITCVYDNKGHFQYYFGVGMKGLPDVNPERICIGSNGLLYVTERKAGVICVHHTDGKLVQTFGKGIVDGENGIGATSDGHIIVSSSLSKKISIFTMNGECIHEMKNCGMHRPHGSIATDDHGNIFVIDAENRIVVL